MVLNKSKISRKCIGNRTQKDPDRWRQYNAETDDRA